MLLKVLGAVDILTGLILIIFGFGSEIQKIILMICGIILLIKSLLGVLKDFASWIDFVGGLIFLFSIAVILPKIIFVIMGILIIQKGIMSFL